MAAMEYLTREEWEACIQETIGASDADFPPEDCTAYLCDRELELEQWLAMKDRTTSLSELSSQQVQRLLTWHVSKLQSIQEDVFRLDPEVMRAFESKRAESILRIKTIVEFL